MDGNTLTLVFPDGEAKRRFAEWLCNSGEQDFFFCEELNAEPGDRCDHVEYHKVDPTKRTDKAERYGPFLEENTIRFLTNSGWLETVPEEERKEKNWN